MVRHSRARSFARSTCLSGGIGVAFAALLASPAAAAPPIAYGGLTWSTDRYSMDTVQILPTYAGRSDVLHLAFGPNGDAENRGGQNGSFYQYQGIQATTGLPGGKEAFYQIDMFIPASWAVNVPGGSVQDGAPPNNFLATIINGGTNTHVDASMWAEVPSAQPPGLGAYPTWGYLNDTLYSGGAPDLYTFDGDLGNISQRAAGTINYGAWNTLRMEYRDTQVLFYVNGTLAYTHTWSSVNNTLAGDPANTFRTLFLNQFHYETAGGANYNNFSAALSDYWNFYYSNLNYGVITDSLNSLSTLLPTNADIQVYANTLTMAPGAGTTGADGDLLVRTGGTITGGTVATPYVISGDATLLSGATLAGNFNIAGTITSTNGTIAPGNSPGVGVAGGLAGTSTILAEVIFNSANAPVNGVTHDFLNVTGNVSGIHTISVIPFAPSTAPVATTGNGIELVRVGGTAVASNFVLSGPVVQGGFQYFLRHLPNYSGTLDGFFLQSGVREEIWGHAAMLSAGKSMLAACHRGNDDRTVETGRTGGSRAWAKYVHGNLETGADTGIATDQDYDCAAGGIDFASGADVRLGLSGGFGDTSVDLVTPGGIAQLDGEQAVIEGHMAYQRERVFMNLTAGYATTDWSFDGPTFGALSATVDGIVGSMQVGMRWALGAQWRVGLMGEVNYDGTSCGDTCLLAGVRENASEWRGGATLRIDGTFAAIRPFLALSYSDAFDGGNEVSMGPAIVTADTASSLFGARAGFDARVSERVGIFLNAGMIEGLDSEVNGYDGQAGLKLYW
jgi:hypothetical protein